MGGLQTKANWVLSALLGYDLHTRVNSLEAGGGGDGGSIYMLDSWANYTEAKEDYYIPASLLVPFRNDLSRLASGTGGGGEYFTCSLGGCWQRYQL